MQHDGVFVVSEILGINIGSEFTIINFIKLYVCYNVELLLSLLTFVYAVISIYASVFMCQHIVLNFITKNKS